MDGNNICALPAERPAIHIWLFTGRIDAEWLNSQKRALGKLKQVCRFERSNGPVINAIKNLGYGPKCIHDIKTGSEKNITKEPNINTVQQLKVMKN